MRSVLEKLGKITFFLAWPVFYVYLNGRERTRVVLVHEGKILATKNWVSDSKWSLPGGGLHKNEPIVPGALRELHEETGVRLKAMQLRHVGHFKYQAYGLHFSYHAFTAELSRAPTLKIQAHEISRAQWFTPTELLGQKDIAPDVQQVLKAWLHQ
jgi:ADP-ribose pyrophosphatase YjhB (NUDIX family)